MPEDRHLGLAEALTHDVDQLVEVRDELIDRHRRSRDAAVGRLAGSALIPVDGGEALLERRVEVTEEARLAPPWPAVQEDQRWVGAALATNHHPLIEAAESEIVDLSDAAGNDLAVWSAEGPRLSQMFHTVLSRHETHSRSARMRWLFDDICTEPKSGC